MVVPGFAGDGERSQMLSLGLCTALACKNRLMLPMFFLSLVNALRASEGY
jgi:hypothetical protein